MSTNIGASSLSSGSGIDVDAIVSNMVEAARAPERTLATQQLKLQAQQAALNEIAADLTTLDSSVNELNDPLGPFSTLSATSSDSSMLAVSAGAGAIQGQHSVVVSRLAANDCYYSNPQTSGSTEINGSLSIKVGTADAVSITIDTATNTLDKLASAINQKSLGVTASVVNDAQGARLVVSGNKTGDANTVVLSGTGSLSFSQSSIAHNAKMTIDGVPVESATNTVSGVLTGVTLTLQNADENRTITLNVRQDTSRAIAAINGFVQSFNTIISAINKQFSYNAASRTAGALSGDAAIRTLQEQLLGQMAYKSDATGNISTLSALGITMTDSGTLAVDADKLSSALNADYPNVQSFFQGDGKTGFAGKFGTLMNALTDSTRGPVVVDLEGNRNSQKAIADQIDDFEVQIEFKRQQWLEQFSKVDAILRQFPLQQQQITAQLNSLQST